MLPPDALSRPPACAHVGPAAQALEARPSECEGHQRKRQALQARLSEVLGQPADEGLFSRCFPSLLDGALPDGAAPRRRRRAWPPGAGSRARQRCMPRSAAGA